jgi:hypothetical protein
MIDEIIRTIAKLDGAGSGDDPARFNRLMVENLELLVWSIEPRSIQPSRTVQCVVAINRG